MKWHKNIYFLLNSFKNHKKKKKKESNVNFGPKMQKEIKAWIISFVFCLVFFNTGISSLKFQVSTVLD